MAIKQFRVLFDMETDARNVHWFNPEKHAEELEQLIRQLLPPVWKVTYFQGAEIKTVAEVLDELEAET